VALAALLVPVGPRAALAHPPGITQRVSVSSNEEQANASSAGAAITPDGRFVAFTSDALNLIPGDVDDAASDVFLRDRQAGTTEGISTTQPPSGPVLHSGSPALSADGRLVAFNSRESNLVAGDTNGRFDIFVFDRQTQTTERVSLSSAGLEGNNDSSASRSAPTARWWPSSRRERWWLRMAAFPWTSLCTTSSPSRPS
jgi:Tol biopolymer transport system component